jgi:hypothetical protein
MSVVQRYCRYAYSRIVLSLRMANQVDLGWHCRAGVGRRRVSLERFGGGVLESPRCYCWTAKLDEEGSGRFCKVLLVVAHFGTSVADIRSFDISKMSYSANMVFFCEATSTDSRKVSRVRFEASPFVSRYTRLKPCLVKNWSMLYAETDVCDPSASRQGICMASVDH